MTRLTTELYILVTYHDDTSPWVFLLSDHLSSLLGHCCGRSGNLVPASPVPLPL